jgi:MSHA biogenesis protein MshM
MADVLDFFGLRRQPFAERARDVVLATPPLRKVLERVRTDLAMGATHLLITGPGGIGKTSLARALPRVLRRSASVAGIACVFDPTPEWGRLRTAIARDLALEGGALSRNSLLAACGHGRRHVVVVDDAHRLSYETLEHLGNLLRTTTSLGDPVCDCILLADPTTGERPLQAWLEGLRCIELALEPLPASAICDYAHRRLRAAGWEGNRLFSEGACRAIHTITGGVPLAVNKVCNLVLIEAAARCRRWIDAELVDGGLSGAGRRSRNAPARARVHASREDGVTRPAETTSLPPPSPSEPVSQPPAPHPGVPVPAHAIATPAPAAPAPPVAGRSWLGPGVFAAFALGAALFFALLGLARLAPDDTPVRPAPDAATPAALHASTGGADELPPVSSQAR